MNWISCDKNNPLRCGTNRYVGCHKFITHFDIQNRGLSIQCLTWMFPTSRGLALWNDELGRGVVNLGNLKCYVNAMFGDPHGFEIFRDVTVRRALNSYGRFGGP